MGCEKYEVIPLPKYEHMNSLLDTHVPTINETRIPPGYHEIAGEDIFAIGCSIHNPKMMSSIDNMITKHLAAGDLHEFYCKVCKKYTMRPKKEYQGEEEENEDK